MFPKDVMNEFLAEMNRQEAERKALINSVLSKPLFNIQMPKHILPKLKIDLERIEKIINQNSNYGWTITQEIGFSYYLEDKLLTSSFRQIDEHFYDCYSNNDWEFYYHTKNLILESIDSKWIDLINECFEGFEQDRFKVIIPTLFSIIEGEAAFIYQTDEIGIKLIEFMDTQTKNEKDRVTKIATYSLIEFMRKQLFITHKFNKNRRGLINRNWVLHGRDDPKYWHKVDALRLINLLSTVQLVKEFKDKKLVF